MQSRMRNGEVRQIDRSTPEEEDVDVEDAGAPSECGRSARRPLDGLYPLKQGLRLEIRGPDDDEIEKRRLVLDTNRARFVQ